MILRIGLLMQSNYLEYHACEDNNENEESTTIQSTKKWLDTAITKLPPETKAIRPTTTATNDAIDPVQAHQKQRHVSSFRASRYVIKYPIQELISNNNSDRMKNYDDDDNYDEEEEQYDPANWNYSTYEDIYEDVNYKDSRSRRRINDQSTTTVGMFVQNCICTLFLEWIMDILQLVPKTMNSVCCNSNYYWIRCGSGYDLLVFVNNNNDYHDRTVLDPNSKTPLDRKSVV